MVALGVYGGILFSGRAPEDSPTVVSSSGKTVSSTTSSPNVVPPRPDRTSPPESTSALRGPTSRATPTIVSVRPEASPRGVASGIRRGEILPGERLETAMRRMGIAQPEIRRLIRALVLVFDAADSHAGDTFIAQTDSSGAVLWFELRTLRGVSVGARRQDTELVAYRKDTSRVPARPATGVYVPAAARNG